MNLNQKFEKVVKESFNIALATSVENQPNVRVVTFGYDENKPGKLFFTTFKGNQKTKEFKINPKVASMPLSENEESDVQVRIFGEVRESTITIDEIIKLIEAKAPVYAETIKSGGEMMEAFEVDFEKAYVTVGMEEAKEINIK